MNTFFVLGFMGCGKSYWSKKWADKYGLTFIEMDDVIATNEGKSIAAIFEQDGEAYFRQKERDVLHAVAAADNCIISTGGGTACFFDNMQLMNESGTTIYLQAAPRLLAQRLVKEKTKRPIISNIADNDLEVFIAAKLAERTPFYEEAKVVLDAAAAQESSLEGLLG
jgi:shikimate kinase